MDEAFMSRVAERIAAATEAVSSVSSTGDPGNLPTMDEWMASHSPGVKSRCADCKAPLVEGSTTICIACGTLLPSGVAANREPFSFDKSLAKKLFYESIHVEDPHDTSSDAIELELQPTRSETKTIANGYGRQQSLSMTGLGVKTDERPLQGGERSKAIVSDPIDSSIPIPAQTLSSKPLEEEADEDYIWESADTDDLGSQAWTQQLARDSTGDPKEFASDDNSAAFYSASQTLNETMSTSDNDFLAAGSISTDLSLSQSVGKDFDFLFPSAPNSVDQSRGEQLGSAAGPSLSKESPGPSVGTDFHDFFPASYPTSGVQPMDPEVQTDPSLREGSAGQTAGDNFDDFFQGGPKSPERSHGNNEETGISFSGEESSPHNIETDFDEFFQAVPKPADQSSGLNVETSAPHTAEGTSSHNIETAFDEFFKTVSEPVDHSRELSVDTPVPHPVEESNGQDGEADFDDFLQAAPRSEDQFGGSNEETVVPRLAEEFSGQKEETHFDFFFQTSSESVNQSHGHNVEAAAAPHFPEKPSVPNVDTDFDFFFRAIPVSGDQSSGKSTENDAANLAEESTGQKVDNDFDDFFQAGHKSGDKVFSQNVEPLFPISREENSTQRLRTDFDFFETVPGSVKVETPVTPAAEGSSGQDGEADFDFFQAAPVPTAHSRGQNTDGAEPNSVEGSGGENIETDFDDFFQAAPKKSANGLSGHNAETDFDYFFQTPHKAEGKVRGTQPGAPDNLGKSNGQTVEPDFDDFFQGASISSNQSQGQKIETVTPNPAEGSVGRNGKTGFADFFQPARNSVGVGESNGHNAVRNFDFFKPPPHSVKEFPDQNASMGFDDFFSTRPHSVNKTPGRSETRDFDFLQASPWSMDNSLEQNGAPDFSNGDFDDFVQAAPQSADKAPSPTEFDNSFQGTTRSVDNSQQSFTDFDDFFQAAPQPADESRHKEGSADLENLFQVAPKKTEMAEPPSSSPGSLVHGNGSGRTSQVGASPISALTQGRSSDGDLLKQFEGLNISQKPTEAPLEPLRKMPNALSDLSFRLADHLIISEEAPTNMWSFN